MILCEFRSGNDGAVINNDRRNRVSLTGGKAIALINIDAVFDALDDQFFERNELRRL